LVAAISIPAFEPLAAFHERIAAMPRELGEPGRLVAGVLSARRQSAQENGVALSETAWKQLQQRAHRVSVEIPKARES
jgi:hypothetical protein